MGEREFKVSAEAELGRSLSWHDRSHGRRFISGGTFEKYRDPVYSAYMGRDYRCRISCSGSGGFIDISCYEKNALCSACQYRKGASTALPATKRLVRALSGLIDLQDPTYNEISPVTVLVPEGCPHATTSAVNLPIPMQMGSSVPARFVSLDEKRQMLMPCSWRLSTGGGKLVLSIQYRQVFVNTDENIFSTSFLYQSVTANLATGQTYVGAMHAPGKKAKGVALENVTYKGTSSFLQEADAICDGALDEPLKQMLFAMPAALKDAGYKTDAHDFYLDGKGAGDILEMIVALNRFPSAGRSPLGWMSAVLSSLAKPTLTRIPRNATSCQFARYLGIPEDSDLYEVLEEDEEARAIAYILTKIGCTDPKVMMYACCGANRDNMIAFFYSFYRSPGSFAFDPTSALKIMVSHGFGKSGWIGWIDSACVSCYGQYDGSDMLSDLAYLVMGGHSLPKCKTLPALGKVLANIWEPNAGSPNNVSPDPDPALSVLEKLEWSAKMNKHHWVVSYNDEEVRKHPFYTRSDSYAYRYVRLDCDGKPDTLILLDVRVCLDGRKWTARHQTEYLSLRQLGDGKNEEQQAREAELDDIMISALVFSVAMRDAEYLLNDAPQYELSPDEVKVLRRWCRERKVDLFTPTSIMLNSKVASYKARQKYLHRQK